MSFINTLLLLVATYIVIRLVLQHVLAKHTSFMERVKNGRKDVKITSLGFCRAQISIPDGKFVVVEIDGQFVETPVLSRQVS